MTSARVDDLVDPLVDLLAKISESRARLGVLGLGYVGLPLALAAAESGFSVLGFDTDPDRVARLSLGSSCVLDVADDDLARFLQMGRFRPTDEFKLLTEADVIALCVPTPLKHDAPDLSFVEAAAMRTAETLRRGQLVILESTTYPGTTEEVVRGILEQSGLRAGHDFFLGFSPERIDPGNQLFPMREVPKIVGGIDPASTALMAAFYGRFIDRVVQVSSARAAEMAKLLENTYRHVNIALVNEIAVLCRDLGIDVWEVIDAAATKPFGFERFNPGPGWGGHCIPVDPTYLSWRVRQNGETARFVELARETNHRMRRYIVQRIAEYLNDVGKSLKGSRLLILGVTYKADVADIRESPALDIISRLRKAGADVAFHDPYVVKLKVDGTTLAGVKLLEHTVDEADVVVVLTAHSTYDWAWIAQHCRLIFDTRNALDGVGGPVVRL